jgi:6-phosphogluconolactonase
MRGKCSKRKRVPDKSVVYFDSIETFSKKAAEFIISDIHNALDAGRVFSLVVSGGNSPRRTYELIARMSKNNNVDWIRVHIFWGDERYVASESEYSNYRMVRELLLSAVDIPDENIHAMNTAYSNPAEAAVCYRDEIQDFFNVHQGYQKTGTIPSFDLVLLGMGPDGHTASIFPQDENFITDKAWVKEVVGPVADPAVDRLTLTLSLINNARKVLFLVSKKGKEKVLEEILSAADGGDLKYPAANVRSKSGPAEWYIY